MAERPARSNERSMKCLDRIWRPIQLPAVAVQFAKSKHLPGVIVISLPPK
jgi:hypothetical protein